MSYAISERLGIVKFQIPNEAPSTALDTISVTKHVIFRTLLQTYRPIKPTNSRQQPMKPAIKFQAFKTIQHHLLKNNLCKTIQHHLLKNNHFKTMPPQLMFVI